MRLRPILKRKTLMLIRIMGHDERICRPFFYFVNVKKYFGGGGYIRILIATLELSYIYIYIYIYAVGNTT